MDRGAAGGCRGGGAVVVEGGAGARAPLERAVLRRDQEGRGAGPVTKFLFKNPHSFLYFEAADDKGQKVEWQVELGAAASLTRTGWTPETLKPGHGHQGRGQPSRAEGSHGMCCAKITRADGSPIRRRGR